MQPLASRRLRYVHPLLALGLAVALAAPAALRADDVDLDQLRESLRKYEDVSVALAEGFIPDPAGHCMTAEMEGRPAEMGAMGLHYFRPDLLGITAPPNPRVNGAGTHTDFAQPAILLYEPQEDGSMVFVDVENLVFQAAWAAASHAEPPVLNGRQWDTMADDPATEVDEAHGFMPHFDQHVWLYRDNPAGILEPFNADVTCPEHAH